MGGFTLNSNQFVKLWPISFSFEAAISIFQFKNGHFGTYVSKGVMETEKETVTIIN